MNVACRAVAVSVVLALAWAGPLAPFAAAQQPTATPPPAPAQVQMYQEDVKPVSERRADVYDSSAAVLTVIGFPLKAVTCVLGFAFGGAVFAASFASRRDAAFGILDEGCGSGTKWIVQGRDLRPRPTATKAFEWEAHRFDWER
jgi:hypothetical protein